MKLRLLILLAAALAASPAVGQTIKSLGYNTTNGNIVAATNVTFTNSVGFSTNAQSATRTNLGLGATWLTNTNATNFRTAIGLGATWLTNTNVTNFRTAIGLGTTNNPIFSALTLGAGDELQINGSGIYSVGFSGQLEFETRTLDQNGLNVFAWSSNSFAVTPPATFATNVTVNGNLSVGSLTTTTPSTWALDATQTAAATNGVLALPSNANVIRLTNNNAISSVTNGVLGAFYYLVNQATNAVTISNVGGITVQGGTSLTLGANQPATLVATGATNASVAARGDLNDVALGGTANTAPSQTASSGSSLMTRSLSDTRFYPLASYWLKAGDMDTFNGAGTGLPTWAEVAPIANMVTPFSRAPRVVPATGADLTLGVFPIPVGWPAGATVKTTTYFVLDPSQSTTNSFFIRATAYWTTNISILTPIRTDMDLVFSSNSRSDHTVTGTGTNAEYFAVTNTLTFATNANPQNRSIMLGRIGTDATDTATNTIYFIGSHVELLP